MRAAWLLVLLPLLGVACGGDASDAGEGVPTPATAKAPAPEPGEPCPECSGSGVSPRTGDGRPCLLCDGDGACPVCRGEGRDRDGACFACETSGRCPGCGGDGLVSRVTGDIGPTGAPLPGQCAFCRYGQGRCPGCAGRGQLPDGRTCAQCDGDRWCPVCRGEGVDPWCGGTGLCPTCRGHGRLAGGRPVSGWPPLRVVLPEGTVVEVRLLAASDRYLSWERDGEDGVRRETVLVRDVDPVTCITALRRFAVNAEDHLRIAEFARERGEHFLYVARSEIEASRRLSPSLTSEALKQRVDLAWRKFLEAAAPGVGAPGEESEAARARRETAETARYRRQLRRAVSWRARAENLLSRTQGGLTKRLRGLRAAEEAWRGAARAANRAPAGLADGEALVEVRRARHLRARSLVACADVLLAAGRPGRARAIAAIALAVEPDDDGARRFAAVVEEAMARQRTEEETR